MTHERITDEGIRHYAEQGTPVERILAQDLLAAREQLRRVRNTFAKWNGSKVEGRILRLSFGTRSECEEMLSSLEALTAPAAETGERT